MKIVVLDGYTLNPGDNPWTAVQALGQTTVYDRTPPEQILNAPRMPRSCSRTRRRSQAWNSGFERTGLRN